MAVQQKQEVQPMLVKRVVLVGMARSDDYILLQHHTSISGKSLCESRIFANTLECSKSYL